MRNKFKFLLSLCLTFVLCLVFCLMSNNSEIVEAAETPTDWVLHANPSSLTISDTADGGVATVSYTSLSSDVLLG